MTIKLKSFVQFPAQVQGSGIATITKQNGIFTFGFDLSRLGSTVILDPSVLSFLAYNTLTGEYSLTNMAALIAAGTSSRNVAGNYSATNYDTYLRLTAQSSIILPPAANRNGLEITVKDVAGVATASPSALMPSGTEDIDGITAGQGGYPLQASYQVIRLKPRASGYDVLHSG